MVYRTGNLHRYTMQEKQMNNLEHSLYIALGTLVNDPEYIDPDNDLVRLFKQEHYDMAAELIKEYQRNQNEYVLGNQANDGQEGC
jgi:hypothetical protein